MLPPGAGRRKSAAVLPETGQECLVIEFAASDPSQEPPKLYVPITNAHLVSKYVGTGKARPPPEHAWGHAVGENQSVMCSSICVQFVVRR